MYFQFVLFCMPDENFNNNNGHISIKIIDSEKTATTWDE